MPSAIRPALQRAEIQRGAGDARFAVADLALRVEQVRDHGRARLNRGLHRSVAGIGMADAHNDSGLGEPGNLFRTNGFRGNGNQEIRQASDVHR